MQCLKCGEPVIFLRRDESAWNIIVGACDNKCKIINFQVGNDFFAAPFGSSAALYKALVKAFGGDSQVNLNKVLKD